MRSPKVLVQYAEASLGKREAEIEYGTLDMGRVLLMRLIHLEYRIDMVNVFFKH